MEAFSSFCKFSNAVKFSKKIYFAFWAEILKEIKAKRNKSEYFIFIDLFECVRVFYRLISFRWDFDFVFLFTWIY